MDSKIDDYTTEKGFKTIARKTQWFIDLPPILMLHLQRFDYDTKGMRLKKVNSPFHFEKEIFLERFSIKSKGKTEKKREEIRFLREKIRGIDKSMEKFFKVCTWSSFFFAMLRERKC